MKKFWNFVLGNLDNLLAIILCVIVSILGIFGGIKWQSALLSVLSAVLGLLAYGSIRDRHAREDLNKKIQALGHVTNVSAVLKNRNAYIPFSDLISSAQQLYMVGASMVNIYSQWSDYFLSTKIIQHGAVIQTIILDPNSPSIVSVAECMNQSIESIKNEIESTSLRVSSMMDQQEKFKNGSIELKLMSSNPNYSMILIDPEKPNGKIIVEFVGYHATLHNRPHIELTKQNDQEWYDHFLQQYYQLWKDSKPFKQ